MTELEKLLLETLEKLEKESQRKHTEYVNSSRELRQMFDDTAKKNDELTKLVNDLSLQVEGLTRLLRLSSK